MSEFFLGYHASITFFLSYWGCRLNAKVIVPCTMLNVFLLYRSYVKVMQSSNTQPKEAEDGVTNASHTCIFCDNVFPCAGTYPDWSGMCACQQLLAVDDIERCTGVIHYFCNFACMFAEGLSTTMEESNASDSEIIGEQKSDSSTNESIDDAASNLLVFCFDVEHNSSDESDANETREDSSPESATTCPHQHSKGSCFSP